MLLDAFNLFSDDQDLSQDAGTYLSDKSIDLGAAVTDTLGNTIPSDIGRGVPIEVFCQMTESLSTGSSPTLQAQLVMADNEALDSNLVVLCETIAIAAAVLVAGYQFRLGGMVPPGISKRFLGMRYILATATTTTGKITAGLAKDRQLTSV